jgi:uncharacterized membrane protein
MACFTLSGDKIEAAPPEARCWLARQILRTFGERPIADRMHVRRRDAAQVLQGEVIDAATLTALTGRDRQGLDTH